MARPNLGNLLSLLTLQRPFGFDRTVLYINSRKHPGLAWIVYSSFKIKKICEFLLSIFNLVGLFIFIIILMMMLIRSNCHIMFIMYYQGVGAGCKISRKLPYKWKGGFTFSGAFWSEHKNRLWRGGGIFVCIINSRLRLKRGAYRFWPLKSSTDNVCSALYNYAFSFFKFLYYTACQFLTLNPGTYNKLDHNCMALSTYREKNPDQPQKRRSVSSTIETGTGTIWEWGGGGHENEMKWILTGLFIMLMT